MSTSHGCRPAFEQQTARINVTDDTWRAFRRLCLESGEHVSEVLGHLVDQQVERRRPPALPKAVDTPAPERVNASTPEQVTRKAAKPRQPAATSRGMTEVLPLFDQPAGDALYT